MRNIMLFKYIYQKINKKIVIIILLILFILGQLFNYFVPHRFFQLNQAILLSMLIIQILVLKEIHIENEKIENCIRDKTEIEVLSSFISKAEKLPEKIITDIISFICVVFYITAMYKIGCLEHTITGIYGGLLGGIVFYIGIQAYFHYLAILYFSYDLRHINIEMYSLYSPCSTDWIRKLAREFSYIEKWFLILGFMYSLIYAINLPKGIIEINGKVIINSNYSLLVKMTWLGILVFYVIALLLFSFLSKLFIRTTICNCKDNSMNKIAKRLNTLSSIPSNALPSQEEGLISLLKTISESDEYPLKSVQSFFDKAYALLVSFFTLINLLLPIIQEIIIKT